MRDVTALLVVALTFLMGRAAGMRPDGSYCIGNQCFTMFQDPSDYNTARSKCRDQEGQLMTVRSSVAQDVILILLGNFTGRFWIGLHLMSGCPNAADRLRGFQWVTKDSESDFSNWGPSFDSSCSSRRCVSVSKADNFKWIPEPCDELAAGYLCEYIFSEPCKALAVSSNDTVIYQTAFGFGGEGLLSLPPGSTAVRMPSETKYICFSEQWMEAPWNCEIEEGGCEHKCAVDPNRVPRCYCSEGKTISPVNKVTCEDAIEDPCRDLRCAHTCYNEGDSYACMCDHGFKLAADGRSCEDFNDCTDTRQCPRENSMCLNVDGGFQCVCKNGFTMIGEVCVDVDECESAPCEHLCENTVGSYKCSCYDGHIADPKSPHKCKLHCGKKECLAECDPNDRYQCFCPEGYISEERPRETVCVDIDECASFYCDQGCKNTFGGYVCMCSPGYTLVDKYKCVKRDGDTDTEGSGAATTAIVITWSPLPYPDPTRKPSAVTVGGLVGIIVCTVFFIVLVVFLVHHIFNRRGKMESAAALKAPEDDAHSLSDVKSDTEKN